MEDDKVVYFGSAYLSKMRSLVTRTISSGTADDLVKVLTHLTIVTRDGSFSKEEVSELEALRDQIKFKLGWVTESGGNTIG